MGSEKRGAAEEGKAAVGGAESGAESGAELKGGQLAMGLLGGRGAGSEADWGLAVCAGYGCCGGSSAASCGLRADDEGSGGG